MLHTILEIFGIIFLLLIVIYILIKVLQITRYLFLRTFGGVQWFKGDHVWAIVTGATDGIGLQYTKQLAAKGYPLLLISRSEERLTTVANDLKKEFNKYLKV